MTNSPFGNCKAAQLHLIQKVQAYGAMLVVDKRNHLFVAATENIDKFVCKSVEELLGHPWSTVLSPNLLGSMFLTDPNEAKNCIVLATEIEGRKVEISNHTNGDHCIIEFEPSKENRQQLDFSQRTSFIRNLAKTNSPEESASLLMDKVAEIIGFDRVLLYKFLPDWHGEVINERLKPAVEGYLGLRFPEGDVPSNARRLFTINLQRLIADVDEPTVELKTIDPNIEVDMSFAQLRAIHPVHIKYLKNLGVPASFSLSIVCEGKLWGLLACHNLSPKVLSIADRQACEELTRITAMHMSNLIRSEYEKGRFDYRVAISEIRGSLNMQSKGKLALHAQINNIKNLFNADGVWQYTDGDSYFSGSVPDTSSLGVLKNWLAKLDRDSISFRQSIPEEIAGNSALVKFASGLIFIPLIERDFILILRQESIEKVNWAGKPAAMDEGEDSVAVLTPRSSFQKWSQELKGHCDQWHQLDIEAAENLRKELLDYLDRSNIEYMALRDNLTGLSNRLSFERKMEQSIINAIENNSVFAVFMIDLDKFKPVNDTFGHAAGDELLIQVSQRLQNLVRDNDTVARLGGDEFAIILSSMSDSESVNVIAKRIIAEMQRPFEIGDNKIEIGASIGVSLCPLDAVSQEELMHEADLALYEVKKAGRNDFKRFEPDMLEQDSQAKNAKQLLTQGFDGNRFAMRYQPIHDSRTGKLASFEAFSVWDHPEDGLVSADEYKHLMETHQLTPQWALNGLEIVFKQYQQWLRSGYTTVPIIINMNAKQFLNLDLCAICKDLADKYQVDLNWLRIDLDEQTLALNSRRSEEKINDLKQLGVLVNIDHFGQGLLSLSLLTRLKIDKIKINEERFNFSSENPGTNVHLEIFRSISKALNIPIVATRLESAETLNIAKEQNIAFVQGHAISKPLDVEAADKYIANADIIS